MNRTIRRALALCLTAAGTAIQAQDAEQQPVQQVVVTGSRILRPDYSNNSPIATVSDQQIHANSDVTLDTFLNTLPQVTPAGTTTSNNPPNNGQSNIDLRGLGANRNLVLIDGRRPMVSASTQTVDLNTIPQALIEGIEVVTGGAGAVYGADAVAGAVNIKLKRNFEGFSLNSSWSNSTEEWDAREYAVDALIGGNFSEDRGNVALGFDYSRREGLIKSQRPFAAVATSTTSYLPEGLYFPSGNAPTQAAVDGVFSSYGVAAGAVPAGGTFIGFNTDGTLLSRGAFNNPANVQNWRYPVDLSVNTRLFPDLYSYNFDALNILTLPLERRSIMAKMNYQLSTNVEVFGQLGWTEYESETALAPTPIPTVGVRAPGEASAIQATSALVEPGQTISNLFVVPATNPFIPADFKRLLDSRTGDNPGLVNAGASEPFLMRQRTLSAGLRDSGYENQVVQYLLGARGPIMNSGWRWEAYASEGHTDIATKQAGNIDTNRLQQLLEAADGGKSVCEGGFNPFGRNPLSQSCRDYLEVSSTISNDFRQQIVQGFVTGDVAEMKAGALSVVVGAEYRRFTYELDPGSAGGPISGFNTQNPSGGRNSFRDVFTEALIPIMRDASWAQSLDLSLGYRLSKSEFEDTISHIKGSDSTDSAYKAELSWQPLEPVRLRASYQRAVRAPNFAELFNGGGSSPQYFDPCSASSQKRSGADAAAMRALCIQTGLASGAADSFEQTPGSQVALVLTGNTALKPETADTVTFGAVFTSPWDGALQRLRGSIDFYSIAIKDPILAPPSPNVMIAECYNYYGSNPTYSAADPNCQAVIRLGGDILQLASPDDTKGDGLFPTVNAGRIKTSGIDLQLDYGFDLDQMGLPERAGSVTMNLLLSRLLEFKQRERAGLPLIDYGGTISYFGEGLGLGGGSSFPEWRATLQTQYAVGDFRFDVRGRWVDSMKNRADVQFLGEDTFTGVGSVAYWDVGGTWNFMERASFRLGVNNVLNKQPPTYAPNVQSGTDPSLYDVIGRRIFGQINVQF